MKDRIQAALLAFFLGGFGAHRFYLGEPGGCWFLFVWIALMPFALVGLGGPLAVLWAIAWIEGVSYLLMSREDFDRRFNSRRVLYPGATVRVRRVVIEPDGARREVYEEHSVGRGPTVDERAPRRERRARGDADYKRRRPQNETERDRFVLQAAFDAGGVLSAPDLAMRAQFTLAEAKEALEALHRHGVCEVEVDSETLVRYVFPDLKPSAQSARMSGDAQTLDEDLHVR